MNNSMNLYRKLQEYNETDYYPYHMPGHKRNSVGDMPYDVMSIDITEIDDFDNLHNPEGILKECQADAAKLFGAEESFYLVGGSTCGILSAVSAVLPEGGHLLMARNCHKSVYHAAYLRNLKVTYLYPKMIDGYDVCEAVTAKQVEEALMEHPDIGSVLIVSPTYEGRIADIASIARVVHEKRIPLIVDEAHGAHLGFQEAFSENSCRQGADIVIHSVHKTLPSMTQTALLHVNGSLVNRRYLRRYLQIYQSSSPSYVLMASINNALRYVEQEGSVIFQELATNWNEMLTELGKCKYLQILTNLNGKQDIGKLVISVERTYLYAQQLYDMLLKEYHLQLEMVSGTYVLAMFTIGDKKEGFTRLTKALLEIDHSIERTVTKNEKKSYNGIKEPFFNIQELSLSKAWNKDTRKCLLEQSAGQIAGEFIQLYPPGIPILVPGERITISIIEEITRYITEGLSVQGIYREKDNFFIDIIKIY